jgi:protein O-mannosyl-transferase
MSTGDANTVVEATSCPADARPGLISAATRAFDAASKRGFVCGLVLLVVVTFTSSLFGDFLHDDVSLIGRNSTFGHWNRETLTRIFTRDSWSAVGPETSGDKLESVYYRPVFILMLMCWNEVAGGNPLAWHVLSLIWQIIAVVIAFLVIERALKLATKIDDRQRNFLAAFSAGVFAIHPVQSETVAWVSGLVGPLMAALMLGSFYFYLVGRLSGRLGPMILALLLFAVALLTKEGALSLVLIVGACEAFVFDRENPGSVRAFKAARNTLPFVIVGMAYFLLRHKVIHAFIGRGDNLNFPDDASLTLVDNLLTVPALIARYIKLIVFPFALSPMYDLPYVRSLGTLAFWGPLLVVVAIAILLIFVSTRWTEARLALILMIAPLLPHLNTRAFVSDEIIHDRYLYISMLGVGLLAATVIWRAADAIRVSRRALASASIALLVVLSVTTILQNRVWKNADVMWQTAFERAPGLRTVLIGLGTTAEQRGQPEKALEYYESALKINPDIIDALNNAAFVYANQKRWSDAARGFERIVSLTPDKAVAHFNLAFAYSAQRRFTDALIEIQRAIDLEGTGPRSGEWNAMRTRLEKASAK